MNKIKFAGYFAIAGMAIISFIPAGNNRQNVQNLTLQNIEALQASAGEAICDGSNDSPCIMDHRPQGGPIGMGTGNLVVRP